MNKILFLLMLATATQALACRQIPPEEAQAEAAKARQRAGEELRTLYQDADQIFVGELVDWSAGEEPDGKKERTTFKFKVTISFKGRGVDMAEGYLAKPKGSTTVNLWCGWKPVRLIENEFKDAERGNTYLVYTVNGVLTRIRLVSRKDRLPLEEELQLLR